MNLRKLFEMQRVLDERIVKEKGLEGKDLLPQKILALQVELGECANEWRGFKFWSKDQQPRYEKKSIAFADPGGPFEHVGYPLLEEYIDCLHFILSIALHDENYKLYYPENYKFENVNEAFNNVFNQISRLQYNIENWRYVIDSFLELGNMLGFTWEQIETAYLDKNKVNHQRQDTGY